MTDPTKLLQELGFSEYEARAYIALLKQNPLNGYELAKASGIPRPNIYAVLQKLEERQAVTPVETASGTRYVPLPPEMLTDRLNLHYRHILTQTRSALEAATVTEAADVIWNLRSYDTILQKAQAIVDATTTSAMLAVWQPEAAVLAEATQAAQARGVKIVTLCLQTCPAECGSCRDAVFRYHVAPANTQRWLIVVGDEDELLFADLAQEQPAAMHTRQPNVVQMANWYIRHSIALAAILSDVGDQVDTILRPDTRTALDVVAPADGNNWLDYMLALVRQNNAPA